MITVSDQDNKIVLEVSSPNRNSALELLEEVAQEIRKTLGKVKLIVKKDNQIHTLLTNYLNE
jgi:hypothetical protein